ncbi:GNAT family N-acetyltransferase [Gaoshiqia sp. Z1-71]|uniref:GNAT family N-acetyltransferase n=1 Tax=Gaoshiqia hydrogeniformans TaxID=3290090 RepID=UPI003BF7FEE6
MRRATQEDKNFIIDILTQSFESNQSVNYIVTQDKKRIQRIRALMDYSFEVCSLFGEVFISEDNKACALIVYPDKKKTSLKSILLDVKLIMKCVGVKNIKKALDREALIKKIQPKEAMTYLWFIGVGLADQNNGLGSAMLQAIIDHSSKNNRPIYLETSTVRNLPWYSKFGFEVYSEQDLSYRLYFLKRELKK